MGLVSCFPYSAPTADWGDAAEPGGGTCGAPLSQGLTHPGGCSLTLGSQEAGPETKLGTSSLPGRRTQEALGKESGFHRGPRRPRTCPHLSSSSPPEREEAGVQPPVVSVIGGGHTGDVSAASARHPRGSPGQSQQTQDSEPRLRPQGPGSSQPALKHHPSCFCCVCVYDQHVLIVQMNGLQWGTSRHA